MRKEQDSQLPVQTEEDIKRKAVQGAMREHMIPVSSFCFCQKRSLQYIVTKQVAEEQPND
jgi:hypothetical protein